MLEAMFEGLATYEDVRELVDAFTEMVRDTKKALSNSQSEHVEATRGALNDLLTRLKAAEKSLDTKAKGSEAATKKELTRVVDTVKKDLRRLRGMIPKMPKEFDATELHEKLEALEGRMTAPEMAEEIRNKLELLEGDERLDVSAIRGLEELINKAKSEGKTVSVGGGPRGLYVFIDGVKKGLIQSLNFAAGSGMSIAFSYVNGQPTMSFEATGSGTTVETPPESPDAVNTVFTVSARPKWVVADGTTYFEGQGYSYAALQITMDIPPSATIRVIL